MGVALTGKDTSIIGTRILADLADGDCVNLDFPNNLVEAKIGKNGNTVYAFNATGKQATATIRVLRGSADDKYFSSEMNAYINDPAAYTLMSGEFIKRIGDGEGNITADIYQFKGGVIQKIPTVKENVEGATDQGVSIYTIIFANTARIMG